MNTLFRLFMIFLLTVGASLLCFKVIDDLYKLQCESIQLPINVKALKESFNEKLFGQPLALKIVDILQDHKKLVDNGKHRPLVLSFHGLSGIGKSHAVHLMASALFTEGSNSQFVKKYIRSQDFPVKKHMTQYQITLKSELRELVKKCGFALIVFDEVNDIPSDVFEVLIPIVTHGRVDGVDYRDVIFVFLSNVGGEEIMDHFYELNMPRNDLSLRDFNEPLNIALDKNFDSELEGSMYRELVDHYIPFLPLESDHVEMCIKTELNKLNIQQAPSSFIRDVMETLSFIEKDGQLLYVKSGCKTISKEVAYHYFRIKNLDL